MVLTLTDEQRELAASLRRFLADKAPREAVRGWAESGNGVDPAVWRQLSEQLGLTGVAIPEEYGGSGFGPVELGVVLEEMGRVLLPGPFFGTVALAGQALVASDDEAARRRWLPGIADGTRTATLAVNGSTTANPAGDGWTLTGRKTLVVDGDTAELILVVAGDDLFAVEAGAAGLERRRLDALDITRTLGALTFVDTPAVRVSAPVDRVVDLAVAALAAEQVGGASACLDQAVAYAKARVQFDRPIGSFQAIKHKCADLLLEVEAARSAALYARSAEPDELAVSAAVAGSYCAGAYTHAAKENIQIHGGIGFTWEHDAHLHLKRAKSGERLLGSPVAHRRRLAALVGI